ncbi:TlpA family protein disulfide reductase [Chryseobacterium sp. SNU WT5]|uniref:TlpA family protein disulfide reductase n=1 Tax=Chryseobacterium sp. SNU WT5 TaxID=2594269 RepID=UPI00117ED01D|nr:TlpA disulfide reductase family protein [Chryseobacterium sp. SNU WT5]QDP86442.1 TlpA family protein disulfide reductase [Chryseobacterium sp. SNU WT5]
MKRVILSIAVFSLMAACNKEAKVDETVDTTTSDSVVIDNAPVGEGSIATFQKVEWSPEETSKMLGKQNNDTLYVTNFFATWCGPCVKEIPHFKAKMAEMKGQPVKFTFVSLDERSEWDKALPKFVAEHGLAPHVVVLDGSKLTPEFFPANFKKWDGGAIPFTLMRKGDKTDETLGSMSEEMLTEKLNSFK